MNTKAKYICFGVSLLIAIMVATCTDRVAGAGSETTNGVTGCAVNESGIPLANAFIKLIPSDYNPGSQTDDTSVITTTTDHNGRYNFKKLKPGYYGLIARYENNKLCGKVNSINIIGQDSIIELSRCQLSAPGTVRIDFSRSSVKTGYCYFPGTDIFSLVDSTQTALIEHVPSGVFDSLLLVSTEAQYSKTIRYNVSISSLQTITINNPEWKYVRTIQLNTSYTGVNLSSTLNNIPVLVRLGENSINFSQVASDGIDLHFTSQTNNTIPHEIEYWDAIKKQATVWLRIDTLYANSTTQSISMYWGNNAISESSKSIPTVFDTTCGFQGVWHLSDISGQAVDDATQNSYDGTSPDTSNPLSVAGMIGNCFTFDGKWSYIMMPGTASGKINFPVNSKYTVSAWVYVEDPDDKSHIIVSKGNTQYFLWSTSIHLSKTLFEFADFRNQSGWDLAVSPLTSGQWVYLTGVREGTSHKLYVNGVCTDTLIDFPYNLPRLEQSDLMIGRFAQMMASPDNSEGYCFFKGKIDEVEISSVARSAEWVRFCYLNQFENEKVVIFK
jgi:hypothetical protein